MKRAWERAAGVVVAVLAMAACSDDKAPTEPPPDTRDGAAVVEGGAGIAVFNAIDMGTAAGQANSIAYGINNAGTTAGVSFNVGQDIDGVVTVWTAGGTVNLGRPGGYASAAAAAINDAGEIVGLARSPALTSGFYWSAATGFIPLVGPPGSIAVDARDINNGGVIVGEMTNGAATHAFRFTFAAGYDDLHPAGYLSSHADGVNNAGFISGWAVTPAGDRHAASWSPAGVFTDLGTLPGGPTSEGHDINNFNAIVGQAETAGGNDVAMLFRPGFGMNGLAAPNTIGVALSDRGRMAGWAVIGGFRRAGTKRGTGPLGLLPMVGGALESSARGVNTCGTMVGSSRLAGGVVHATRWTNIPCD
jgi:probable HAF family extracellular repeat protein